MPSRHLRHILLLLPFVFAIEPAFTQPAPSDTEQLQARIDAAALAHARDDRYRGLSPKDRQGLAEFVAGNMLFALLHEAGHAVVNELGLPVLGREEDAADSFAATRLIIAGSASPDRVLAEAAKGWFMTNRRCSLGPIRFGPFTSTLENGFKRHVTGSTLRPTFGTLLDQDRDTVETCSLVLGMR
jgi:Putative metallopeptidase